MDFSLERRRAKDMTSKVDSIPEQIIRGIPPWQAICVIVGLLINAGISYNKFESLIASNTRLSAMVEQMQTQLHAASNESALVNARVDELQRAYDKLESRVDTLNALRTTRAGVK